MITLGYASRQRNVEFEEKMKKYFNNEVEIISKICNIPENGKYISEAYNEILDESKTDIVIFVHDNIEFINAEKYLLRVDKAIEYQFEHNPKFSIIGVGPRCQYENDIIVRDYFPFECFYTECEEDGSERREVFSGFVPRYSLDLIEDDIVDGCFMAVMKSRLKARFLNDNKSFDFYDVELCLGNIKGGAKVGLTKSFNLLHYRSREERLAWDTYAENKIDFLKRWEGKLPIVSNKNKPSLIILTPSCNTENLPELSRNIAESFRGKNINVLWVIAYDRFNSPKDCDLNAIISRICQNNVTFFFKEEGAEGRKNYGGDLLNVPLIETKDTVMQNIDPWVYVLDDDNFICPLMADQLSDMIFAAEKRGKRAIWMSMNREDGFIDTIRSYSIYGKGAFNNNPWSYADEFMPDPSELVIRYSKLEEMGFYNGGYEYDQKFWKYFYEHPEELTLPEEWHIGHWNGRGSNNFFQCYHDGNNKDMVPYVEKEIAEKKPISFSLVVGTNEQCDRFVLSREEGVDAFKKYAQTPKYRYSVLTCIFGGYESLKEIKDYRDDVEYVCVTDDKNLTSKQWKIVYEEDFFNKIPEVDRFAYVRFHPFNFVTTDVCITVDASMEILRDFYNPIIKTFLEDGYEYAVSLHYDNETLYDDIQAWQSIRGYKKNDYEHILSKLGDDAKNVHGEVQGGFIIHKNTRYANKINEMTWELCHAFSTDNSADRNFQVELSYVLNKICNDESKIMLVHPYIIEGSFIRHWTHSGQYWVVYDSLKTCPCVFWNKKVEPKIFDIPS